MADYPPPTENLPIFNNSVFIDREQPLTIAYADSHYLRFPYAQGTENLATINVSGVATFGNTSSFDKPITMTSATSTDRVINSSTYEMIDRTTNLSNGFITSDSGNFLYDNNGNGTSHIFYNDTAAGTQVNTLLLNTTNMTISTTAPPTLPLATMPDATDSTTKIPTTAWVQSAIAAGGGGGGATSTLYTSSQVVTVPAGCKAIDVLLMGAGGAAGADLSLTFWGGSGSGGNTLSCSNIPMNAGEVLTLTINNSLSSITRSGVVEMSANSGLNGAAADGTAIPGALSNQTNGIADVNLGAFYNTFGRDGAGSTGGGGIQPNMANGAGCPRGSNTWVAGGYGMAQRIPSEARGPGFILITYRIGA